MRMNVREMLKWVMAWLVADIVMYGIMRMLLFIPTWKAVAILFIVILAGFFVDVIKAVLDTILLEPTNDEMSNLR